MAKILIVPDSYGDQQNLVLAGAGGRNLPVHAVDPSSAAPAWMSVLAAGNTSGPNEPTLSLGTRVAFIGDALGGVGGYLQIDSVGLEFVLSSRQSAAASPYDLRLLGGDTTGVGDAGSNVLLKPGVGTASGVNGAVVIEVNAWGTAIYADDNGVSFWDGTPAHKPIVNGAKGGNAALASLLFALEDMGLITDNTT